MKYDPSHDLPIFAREIKSLSPSKLQEVVLNKRNEEVTPESITMWFKRHPQVFDELSKELVQGIPMETQAVDATLFSERNFKEAKSIQDWILFMSTRRRKGKALKADYVLKQIAEVRWVCKEFNKHPDRLSYRDAQEIFLALESDPRWSHWSGNDKVKGKDTASLRRAIKDFLKSKGSADWEKIGVGKPSGFGRYKDLFVSQEVALKMLDWVKTKDFRVYVIAKIMFHNGLRINAVVTARIDNFKEGTDFDVLTVTEKFREVKTFEIIKSVGELVKAVIGDRTQGLIFDIDEDVTGPIYAEAIRTFAPEIIEKYGHVNPNHFWRHIFFQLMLRATDWNSDVVADLGQCTVQSLKESYGAMTMKDHKKNCIKYLPMLEALEVKA